MPTRESEQRRRLSPLAARAAPPASPRPFPQPDPSPQSPSSVTSLCRVVVCKVAAPPFVPKRVIGPKRIGQNLGRARLDSRHAYLFRQTDTFARSSFFSHAYS